MAYLFPPKFPYPREPKRRAEMRFYEACRNQLDDLWTVVYSVPYHGHIDGRNENSDADFMLLHPKMGIYCVEVKGGQEVGLSRGEWFTVPHGSQTREWCKNPFKQAENAKRNLHSWLSDNLPSVYRGGSFGHFVAFPGCNPEGDFTAEARRALYCTANELANLKDRLGRFAHHFKQKVELDTRAIQQIVTRLFPTRSFAMAPSANNSEVRSEQEFLTDRQLASLHCLRAKERVCLTGPAGTGKSLLARHHAQGLSTSGLRVLLACHSWARLETVKFQFESSGVEDVRVHSQRESNIRGGSIRLVTPKGFYDFLWDGANEFPEGVVVPNEFGVDVHAGGLVLPLGLDELLREDANSDADEGTEWPPRPALFDVLIVDEAQMFTLEDFDRLQPALVDGALIYIFGDDAQKLISGPSLLEQLPSDFVRRTLSSVCRSTAEIVDFANVFADSPFVERGPKGRPVELIKSTDAEIQQKVVSLVSEWQQVEDISPNNVKILRHAYFGEVHRQVTLELEESRLLPKPPPDWNPFETVDERDESRWSASRRRWESEARASEERAARREHLGDNGYSEYPTFAIRWQSYFDLQRRLSLPFPDEIVKGFDDYHSDFADWVGVDEKPRVDAFLIEDFVGCEADGVILILDSNFPSEPEDNWRARMYSASSRARLKLAIVGVADHISRLSDYQAKSS